MTRRYLDKSLKLERPLLIFDLEATGLSIENARIIEFAAIRLSPDGNRTTFQTMVNPEQPVPPEVQEITGITDHDVADAPAFRDLVDDIDRLLENADVGGYNAAGFDVPLLRAEYGRLRRPLPGPFDRVVLDSLEILRKHEVRNLSWAHQFYFGTPITDAHRALADVEATEQILFEQSRRYGMTGAPKDLVAALRYPYIDSRRKLRYEQDDVVVCFGKYSDRSLKEIFTEEPTYIDWMVETLDAEVADIVRIERDKLRAAQPDPRPVPPRADPTRRRIG